MTMTTPTMTTPTMTTPTMTTPTMTTRSPSSWRDARSRVSGGTGLGLAIAPAVVVDHGGTIAVDPVAPGVRFVVDLPAADGSGRTEPGHDA
jgi:signal transduction histidine kinase